MFQLPRSPRWLVQHGRQGEALDVLLLLRETEEEAHKELGDIVESYEASMVWGKPRWGELLSGRLLRLLLVGVALQMLQQLVGMSAIMYFGPRLFKNLGWDANVFQFVLNVVNLSATFPSLYLVDKSGRRSLLVWGAVGLIIACSAVGSLGLLMASEGTEAAALQPVIAAMVFFFVVNAAYGWGPIPWVYCAEIFPLKHRARCSGITTMANWVGNFLVAQFTPVLFETIGFGTFFVFGFNCCVALALGLWLPETRGIPLEQIDAVFDAKLGVAAHKTEIVGNVAPHEILSC